MDTGDNADILLTTRLVGELDISFENHSPRPGNMSIAPMNLNSKIELKNYTVLFQALQSIHKRCVSTSCLTPKCSVTTSKTRHVASIYDLI